MKVIKKVKKQAGWSKEYSCTGKGNDDEGCGARLLVSEEDIFITKSNCLHETDYYYTFKRPECAALTNVRGIPGYISKKAMRKYRS